MVKRAITYLLRIIDVCIIILIIVLLTGCATRVEYVKVYQPAPPTVERPMLETQNLRQGDGPDTVIQAHRIDIVRLKKWGLELEALLDGYRKDPK